jgi:hypothetical protein
LGDTSKGYLPPLHTKLGLIKISVKQMNKKAKDLPIEGKHFPK